MTLGKAHSGAINSKLKLKAETDIANVRERTTEAMIRERERVEEIIRVSKARVQEEEGVNRVMERRNRFTNEQLAATDLLQSQAQKLFAIDEERLETLRKMRQVDNFLSLPAAERLAREIEINAVYDERMVLTKAQNEQDIKNTRDFSKGWEKAYNTYTQDARQNFETAGRIFGKITKGMEDAVVEFSKTGKFQFNDFLMRRIE